MPKKSRPRRGSLAFSPRKRAKREIPHIRSYFGADERKILGFAGYKAGMTQIVMDGIVIPATIIETPRMKVEGIRIYAPTEDGKMAVTDVLDEESLANVTIDDGVDLCVIMTTLPNTVSGIPKKEPEVMELGIGGKNASDKFDYATSIFKKSIHVSDVLTEGDKVDVTAVTKGKGIQGPVKRWGISIQDRKAQRSGKGRHVGVLGPWHPAKTSWRAPQAGQTGYHQRTERNKQILKISSEGEEITPPGGFTKYGAVRNEYVALKGSTPGPAKRLTVLRKKWKRR